MECAHCQSHTNGTFFLSLSLSSCRLGFWVPATNGIQSVSLRSVGGRSLSGGRRSAASFSALIFFVSLHPNSSLSRSVLYGRRRPRHSLPSLLARRVRARPTLFPSSSRNEDEEEGTNGTKRPLCSVAAGINCEPTAQPSSLPFLLFDVNYRLRGRAKERSRSRKYKYEALLDLCSWRVYRIVPGCAASLTQTTPHLTYPRTPTHVPG